MKWKPRDVIALVVIVGCFALLGIGRDSYISWTLLGVVSGYYGLIGAPTVRERVVKYRNGKEDRKCSKEVTD